MDRINAALGATRTEDLTKVAPTESVSGGFREVKVDFTSAFSQTEIENMLASLIGNIASMRDHARRAFKDAGIDPDEADAIADEPSNAIVRDLFDREKHGGKSRSGGYSGLDPKLTKQVSFLRMSGGCVVIGPELQKVGAGHACIAVDAEVIDADGNRVGELTAICEAALTAWEDGLTRLGFDLLAADD
ncbi:hypothetical protein HQ535_04275 [bacterium]|nr:hypothetical protein [bacterium]